MRPKCGDKLRNRLEEERVIVSIGVTLCQTVGVAMMDQRSELRNPPRALRLAGAESWMEPTEGKFDDRERPPEAKAKVF